MYTVLAVLISIAVLLIILRVSMTVSPVLRFFIQGMRGGFLFSELRFLWPIALADHPDNPYYFYSSKRALSKSIAALLAEGEKHKTTNTESVQAFLHRLYTYRTKAELDPYNKRGIRNTRFLTRGQKLSILRKGSGMFSSHVMHSGSRLIVSLPLENGELTVSGAQWLGKRISVYFHRQGDAFYVFDTLVAESLLYNGRNALALAHSAALLRSQKRTSVRCKCSVQARLFLGAQKSETRLKPESSPGLKCVLEDISEGGALIRIGGKAKQKMLIKLQFQLEGKTVIMYGISKSFEYDEAYNESYIHFQCLETTPWFKNIILGYVYKTLPDETDSASLSRGSD
ncbi:PilZ domain-containing protein [Treponema sp. HNW]|uniref:PilZ domain-containing protein n=1 Tax=Treponema sp. HNW TaxID=3116654 RepID=UPI003D0E5100